MSSSATTSAASCSPRTPQEQGFAPCSLIVVKSVDKVATFFEAVFQCPKRRVVQVPCRYATINISPTTSVVLIESGSCDEDMKATFGTVSVRQLFFYSPQFADIQQRALKMGILVNQSGLHDGHGSMCVVEGPEGIFVHVLGAGENRVSAAEIIMNALLDKPEPEVISSKPAEKSSSARPAVRTLDVMLQSDYHPLGLTPCPANSRRPTPFETELFKGTAMIMVRTEPVDEHFADFFSGRKRMFEVQVQGKFKRMPLGEIYVGADVTNKVELGIVTRSFSRVILKFIQSMVNNLHYSLGDFPDTPGFEKPHLVAPLFPTMDKIVETPEGQVPPTMGVPFPEDPEYRKLRFKNRCTNDMINLSSTYSFSVNTSNMDLLNWSLVGIPMLHNLDLRTFFGESPIRLVGYEMPADEQAKFPSKHPACAMNYVFNMRLTPVNSQQTAAEDSEDSENSEELSSGLSLPSPALLLSAINEEHDQGDLVGSDEDGEDHEHDHSKATEGSSSRKLKFRRLWRKNNSTEEGDGPPEEGRRKKIGKWLKREIGDFFHSDKDSHSEKEKIGAVAADAGADDSYHVSSETDMEGDDDLRYCPACIDALDHRKEGKRRTLFAFPWVPSGMEVSDSNSSGVAATSPNFKTGVKLLSAAAPSSSVSILSTPATGEMPPYIIKLRSHSEFERSFPIAKPTKVLKWKRLTDVEKERRQLAEMYATMLNKSGTYKSVMDNFFGSPNDADRLFLSLLFSKSTGAAGAPSKGASALDEQWEGSVAFASDKRHWIEGVAYLSRGELIVCKSADIRKVVIRIPMQSVFCVRAMKSDEIPMDMFGFFQVETFSRVHYFLVRSDKQRDGWLNAFASMGATSSPNYSEVSLSKLVENLYFGNSTAWTLNKKRLFNYRNIIFRRTGLSPEFKDISVTRLSEGLLEKVFSLLQSDGLADVRQWIEFMNWASALQAYDLYSLEGTEKVAVLLNIFHSMVLHGMIILGPPAAWSSWPSFFNLFSYIISYEYICLSEFEYNVLRGAMAKPSAILSKIRVPDFGFPGLALTERDFRLNFCINNGSLSMPSVIPVYYKESLDRQLDEVTTQMLSETARVEVERKFVTLPRICSWFISDFNGEHDPHALPTDLLRIIAPYLKDIDRLALMRMTQDGIVPSVRFRPFNFRCRLFTELIVDPPADRHDLHSKVSNNSRHRNDSL